MENQRTALAGPDALHCYASSCGRVTLYLGDSLAILPTLENVGAVVTDPPYPDYLAEEYGYHDGILDFVPLMNCRQLVFWSARANFPHDFTARHVWDKRKGGVGSAYEFLYEVNGSRELWVLNYISSNNAARAAFGKNDTYTGHPSQKPLQLMGRLVRDFTPADCIVCDPFMGSGTTGIACIRTGRRFIGIERNPAHYATALERIKNELAQGDLFLGHNT